MPEIVTDQEVLCKKSEPANDLEIGDIIEQLSITIPDHAHGLAAPQIGIHKRIFLANLSSGSYAFVNPEITWKSPDKVPSIESCLSLPGIRNRCVERHSQIQLSCYKRIDMSDGDLVVDPEPMRLKAIDAVVVQHEYDHLNGVLITHLPITLSREARKEAKDKKRMERIAKARLDNENKKPPPPKTYKLNAKNLAKKKRAADKAKKQRRAEVRRDRIRVEIQERYAAEKKGLFSKDTPAVSDAITKPKQD